MSEPVEIAKKFEVRKDRLTGETVYYMTHPTGVRIAICPKPAFRTSHAILCAKYGSIDNHFSVGGGEFTRVPDGIAHYLEHKLFENEDCDAFEKFAKTGACANAFTSFDRTCYYFSCTMEFEECLRILLDFVQKPYFTDENVQKERGIIAQEIAMYRDRPSWWLYHNFFDAMYKDHPIKIDIAGTEESISNITPELLYQCYNTFYNPGNMVLCVSGNVDPMRVLTICDEMIHDKQKLEIVSQCPEDDGRVLSHFSEHEDDDVPVPLFMLGFKQKWRRLSDREGVLSALVRSAVFGPVSDFYSRMMEKELINPGFSCDGMYYPGVQASVFSGMSHSPEALRDEIIAEIERVKREGIPPDIFECVRRASYGAQIVSFNSTDDIADNLSDDIITGSDMFEALKATAEVTVEEGNEAFGKLFDTSNSSLSVVRRGKEV